MVLNAGDATFHSGMMAHAAAANMTPKPRRAMTCAYMPDGETLYHLVSNELETRCRDRDLAAQNGSLAASHATTE